MTTEDYNTASRSEGDTEKWKDNKHESTLNALLRSPHPFGKLRAGPTLSRSGERRNRGKSLRTPFACLWQDKSQREGNDEQGTHFP